jgi:hypothetical protein
MLSTSEVNTLIIIGVQIVSVAGIILTNRNDTKWVIKNFDDHRKDDEDAFNSLKADVRELRNRLNK